MRARDGAAASGLPKWAAVGLMILAAIVLGATVLREPIAYAMQAVDAKIIGPLDGQGDVRVHEQGTAKVDVTNASVPVKQAGEAVTIELTDNGLQYVVPSRKRLVIEYVNGAYGNAPHAAAFT